MWNKPKKSLGQHFLSDRNILMDMVRAGNVSKRDIVLEIGPGTGNLTELLVQYAKRVIAIEKDRELVSILLEKFKSQPNIKIIHGDVLEKKDYKLNTKNYKLIANIPYYITGRLLRIFLSENHLAYGTPSTIVLMLQKEVARRICAKNGKESLLSISVKTYGSPKIIRIVPKGAFHPSPKVDSAILAIENISDRWFLEHKIEPKPFFDILKRAFQQKRKTLKNSLKVANLEGWTNRRPEELKLEDWAQIISNLQRRTLEVGN